MSYGFEVRNSNNIIVIDSEFPTVFLANEVSVTGTAVGRVSGVWRFTASQTGLLPFFNIPVGEWVSYSVPLTSNLKTYFYSSQQTLTIRKAVALSEISYTPDSHGLEVYNASGDPMFSSSRSLIPIVGFTNDLEDQPSQGQFSEAVNWVCPVSSVWAFVPISIGESVLFNKAIRRSTTSSYDVVNKLVDTISGQIGVSGGSGSKAIFAR
jgi:hypothetical protein